MKVFIARIIDNESSEEFVYILRRCRTEEGARKKLKAYLKEEYPADNW